MFEKRLFLLDAYALIFRAYYALIKVPRITSDGFNTSAIFGFVNTLEELLRKEHPSHIAVCFDPAGPTFRSEAYAEYKGERSATPEDIKVSVPIIKEIIWAYNIPVVEKEGFEADDVIGTLAKKAEKEGFTTYMMTPDKDFGQLVSPNTLQYKPAYKGGEFEIRGEEEIKTRYGLTSTSQVIDLLALMGDKIDNIPGCPGVGEKTAVKLIAEFGSVENLIANTGTLKGALKKKVEDNSEQIKFSKFLATIRTDVPLDITPDELATKQPDCEKLFAIFRQFEFRTLIQRVSKRLNLTTPTDAIPDIPSPQTSREQLKTHKPQPTQLSLFETDKAEKDMEDVKYAEAPTPASTDSESKYFISDTFLPTEITIVDSRDKLIKLNETLSALDSCAMAILSEGDNDMTLKWLGAAIAIDATTAFYIPTLYAEGMAVLLDIMARQDIEKVTVNAKTYMVMAYNARRSLENDIFNRHIVKDANILCASDTLQNFFDITLAHYLLEPDLHHNIDSIAQKYLSYSMLPPLKIPKKGQPPLTESEISRHLCEEACITLLLRTPLEEAVKQWQQWELLTKIEFPLSGVLANMEITGVCIDEKALNTAAAEMDEKIKNLEHDIHIMAGEEFNVGSPAKVGEILFDKLSLDNKAKKTKTGQYSTSESQLEKIAHKSPIVGKILEYRKLRKLLNTYLTTLPSAVNPTTGKVHTNYNQTVTATGRISSSNPNLQNIPVREDVGREIRKAFIPSPGNLFLSADYSQIELRLVADFAKDETMLSAFNNDMDIHAITAAKIYHKPASEVTGDERRHAKTANFGILYGITPFGLASRLSIPRSDAKTLIDNYFSTFPTIKDYISGSIETARKNGYATTVMGRRRRLPDIKSANPVVRGYAERNAVNAPIQGSAADIIKKAMIDIEEEMRKRNMQSKMIMQVHDELNFDVVPDELAELQELVSQLMEGAYSGRVRLDSSSGVADNWLDAH